MYHFSLIDKLKNNELYNQSNNDENNENLDLQRLNVVITDALQVYNEEVLNVSKINEEIDRLDRKNQKIIDKIDNIDKRDI